MDRRALLSAVGVSLGALSGCVGDDDSNGPSAGGADSAAPNDGASERAASISVELRTPEYVVNAYEPSAGRGVDPDDVVPEAEVPSALRGPLSAARDGRFETDAVSDDLLAAVDGFRDYAHGRLKPYVELDGTRYVFDPSLPTFAAALTEETVDDYDESRVFRESTQRSELDAEAAETFVSALTAFGTNVARQEYRRCVVPEPVSAFLEEYDYLEDQFGVSPIETATENADPPYTITARELTEEIMWDRPVVDESELDDELVAFFERALASPHRKPALSSPDRSQYFTDDVPAAYGDLVEASESPPYYRIDGTVYDITVGEPRYDRLPVSLSVAGDAGDDREFALTAGPDPDGDVQGPYTFTSRGALPSALWVRAEGDRRPLEVVGTDGADGPESTRTDRTVRETLDASDEITARYAVPEDLPAGTYASHGLFRVSWSVPDQTPDEHGVYPFELSVDVPAGDR